MLVSTQHPEDWVNNIDIQDIFIGTMVLGSVIVMIWVRWVKLGRVIGGIF